MKHWLHKHLPTKASLKKKSEIKMLKPFLKNDALWSFDCNSVAKGVGAGLAGAVIPGFQILYASVLAILVGGNLPIALVATLVTNPLTAIPMIYFIYYIGGLVLGNGDPKFAIQEFHWDFSSAHAFWSNVSGWMMQFGKAFFVGLPIVSLGLGVLGYASTKMIWQIYIRYFSKKKKR